MVLRIILACFSSRTNRSIDKANRICDACDSDIGVDKPSNVCDHINDLPSDIINEILHRLPTQDAIKTSALSRQWRYTWVSVRRLEFKKVFFQKCKHLGFGDSEISSIISRILMQHDGPIYDFTLVIPRGYSFESKCFNNWISFLSRSGLQHFILDSSSSGRERYYFTPDSRRNRSRGVAKPCQMPSHFFSCKALITCELHNFELVSHPPTFKGFKNLLKVKLCEVKLESGTLMALISGSPVLALLHIYSCYGLKCIDVSSTSLEDLRIIDCEDVKSISLKSKNLKSLIVALLEPALENLDKNSMPHFMECLPNIEKLFLGNGYTKSHVERREPDPEHLKELDCKSYCYSQFKTVKIEVTSAFKHALDLMRFILANSSSLEILTFKIIGLDLNRSDTPLVISALQVLLQMERASPKAQVKFIYDDRDE
ncbi:hypothetical protein RIF29_16376 [Crotalaria pallida]|uniref:F-box domain-containing protein n=1 Tax=Crotalaria pallida TaxID=3830 RepID=A0AAN9FIS6_CROPI